VKLGRFSVSSVEVVLQGLKEGDRVILSDHVRLEQLRTDSLEINLAILLYEETHGPPKKLSSSKMEGVTKIFRTEDVRKRTALSNIDLTIDRGDYVFHRRSVRLRQVHFAFRCSACLIRPPVDNIS